MNIYPRYQEETLKAFAFLISDFGFVLTENEIKDSGAVLVYSKDNRSVRLVFDRREERFYYYLLQPEETQLFLNLFIRCDPALDWKSLEPTFDNYEEALTKNVQLLKKYGVPFLSGE